MNKETAEQPASVLATKRLDMLRIDPLNIVIEEGFNVRTDMGDLNELADSIVNSGQLEPVTVHKVKGEEKYILTDGHRRYAAIMLAREKGTDIPYVIAQTTNRSSLEDRVFAMVITGVGKKPLTSVEEAEAYQRLIGYGYKANEIAKRVGKSISHITTALLLADVPKEVKNAINEGSIAPSTVINIARNTIDGEEVRAVVKESLAAAGVDADGKQRKVKQKDVKNDAVLTNMQKLEAANQLIEAEEKAGSKAKYSSVLYDLLIVLSDKTSTVEDIADMFR